MSLWGVATLYFSINFCTKTYKSHSNDGESIRKILNSVSVLSLFFVSFHVYVSCLADVFQQGHMCFRLLISYCLSLACQQLLTSSLRPVSHMNQHRNAVKFLPEETGEASTVNSEIIMILDCLPHPFPYIWGGSKNYFPAWTEFS